MNNKEFVSELSRRMGYKNERTQRMLSNMLSTMGDYFVEGDALQVPNFGTFEVKKKMERVMVNPSSGQRMLVPPKLVLGFKPHQTLKDKVKNGGDE